MAMQIKTKGSNVQDIMPKMQSVMERLRMLKTVMGDNIDEGEPETKIIREIGKLHL